MEKVDYIWMDGQLLPWENATTHILTHTLHYGAGVFEGIRCYNTAKGPAVFRLKDHVDRLFNSASLLKIKIPFTKEQIIDAIKETIKANKLSACYIRPIVYYGYGVMGLNPKGAHVNVAIAVWPWGTYLGEEGLEKGIKVKISSYKRVPGPLNQAKICGNYFNSILAKKEALEASYDEAIMFDTDNFVAEGSGENIFIIKNNKIITPKLNSVLKGITRASILQLAKDLGYATEEKDITKEELLDADEAFFTGTAAEVTPIRQIDDKIIDQGKRGPITEQLQAKFFDIVNGKDERYLDWLEFL